MYAEIRIDYCDEDTMEWYVDAWKTDDANEEGTVIAIIDMSGDKAKITYLDDNAKTDEYSQECIREFLEDGYILTE